MQAVLLFLALGLPTTSTPNTDPEYKPVVKPMARSEEDDYAILSSPWHEPKATLPNTSTPQTGSLISISEQLTQQDPVSLIPKDPTLVKPLPTAKLQDVPHTQGIAKANPPEVHYPISKTQTERAYKESSEKVANVPVPDPNLQDIHGVYPQPVVFDRPDAPHPMEERTPLADNLPCDPSRVIQVTIPVTVSSGGSVPLLPNRFGCSSHNDSSREKLSPPVSWTNIATDAFEFSLQMVEMGDDCSGKGPTAGRIGWHVTGIKFAPQIDFIEGASHDKRLLHGGEEQPNQWLEEYYSGPCPPAGTTGCYRFKVLAHRANGWCQCGFQDVLFKREADPNAP